VCVQIFCEDIVGRAQAVRGQSCAQLIRVTTAIGVLFTGTCSLANVCECVECAFLASLISNKLFTRVNNT
jgi:hypothetical protein